MHDIYDLSNELDRLFPEQVDTTRRGNGRQEAGHEGDDYSGDWPSVGWYCAGGNQGNSLFAIHPDDVSAAVEHLKTLDNAGEIKAALEGFNIEWHV